MNDAIATALLLHLDDLKTGPLQTAKAKRLAEDIGLYQAGFDAGVEATVAEVKAFIITERRKHTA